MFTERIYLMKAAGITAEYNPLHNGHVYHIEETRRITGCDAVVVAMSGDYVQRGEPAFMDKWVRTEHALRSGADLVLEIPVFFCLGNARQYAAAAVKTLEATGKVTDISFGSESGDTESLLRIAGTLRDNEKEIESAIKDKRDRGLSYPAARAQAYSEVSASIKDTDPDQNPEIKQDIRILEKANDILAIEYIKAMEKSDPVVILREGAGYGDPYDERIMYQNASALRTQAFDGRDISGFVPEYTYSSIKNCHLTGPDRDKWFDTLRYAVLSNDTETIEDCPSGGEGLASLLKESAASAASWSDLIRHIKSKRYTYTRLSRLCMQLVLGISRSKYNIGGPEYIRVLGFSEKGRELLAEIRDEETALLPVIINVNKSVKDLNEKAAELLQLDMHASDVYNLMTTGDLGAFSDHRHSPVMIKK